MRTKDPNAVALGAKGGSAGKGKPASEAKRAAARLNWRKALLAIRLKREQAQEKTP